MVNLCKYWFEAYRCRPVPFFPPHCGETFCLLPQDFVIYLFTETYSRISTLAELLSLHLAAPRNLDCLCIIIDRIWRTSRKPRSGVNGALTPSRRSIQSSSTISRYCLSMLLFLPHTPQYQHFNGAWLFLWANGKRISGKFKHDACAFPPSVKRFRNPFQILKWISVVQANTKAH